MSCLSLGHILSLDFEHSIIRAGLVKITKQVQDFFPTLKLSASVAFCAPSYSIFRLLMSIILAMNCS